MKFIVTRHAYKNIYRGLGLALVIAAVLAPAVVNASSQSFNVLNNQAQTGMLMSLTSAPGVVEPSNTKNAQSLVGIIAADTSSLTQQAGQTSVVTDGQALALVSTLGGDIRVGDRIGVSSLSGVGTRLTTSGWMVGVAEGSLDAKSKGAIKTNVSDTSGGKHSVYVARIPVLVKVNYFNAPASNVVSAAIPDPIQRTADAIAGKRVPIWGLLLSFILLLVGIVYAGFIIYAAVRGGIDAIARQPLSKVVINRAMLRSLALAGFIIVGAVLGAFVLLKIL